jgi:hypothetical protein
MKYDTIISLSDAVELLETFLGKNSNVLYEDIDKVETSTDIEIKFAGDIFNRYTMEKLSVIPAKTYLIANGVEPKLTLKNIITSQTNSYPIRIIDNGIISALKNSSFKKGFIYTLYFVEDIVNEEEVFILYSHDFSEVETRLNELEIYQTNVGSKLSRRPSPTIPGVFEILTNDPANIGTPLDILVTAGVRSFSFLQSQNVTDNGQPNGVVELRATLNISQLQNIVHAPILNDWQLISKKFFDEQVDEKVETKYNERFVSDARTPQQYEIDTGVELENGTIYLQLEVI